MSLMTYTGSSAGARKYVGDVATGYDAKRQDSPKWKAEQEIIEGIIDSLPRAQWVLDVPVGTGRFIEAYERNGHRWHGVDMSEDMLAEAKAKVVRDELAKLQKGNVTRLDVIMEENGVDVAIMCRLTRWLTPEQRVEALQQLQRAAQRQIVFTARIANHPHAYPVEEIEAALDGWCIAQNIECSEPDYRVIVLEPKA